MMLRISIWASFSPFLFCISLKILIVLDVWLNSVFVINNSLSSKLPILSIIVLTLSSLQAPNVYSNAWKACLSTAPFWDVFNYGVHVANRAQYVVIS